MDPITIGALISAGTGLLTSILGGGESPSEEKISQLLDQLMADKSKFTDMPFSKDEIMNAIVPAIQSYYQQAADVSAGSVGARLGEADVAGGQATSDLFMQQLAPIIAKGQQQSAQAEQWGVGTVNQMDKDSKNMLAQFYQMALGGSQGMADMSSGQRDTLNFLTGSEIGGNMYGNLMTADYILGKNVKKKLPGSNTQNSSNDIVPGVPWAGNYGGD